jgi:rubrerythrin
MNAEISDALRDILIRMQNGEATEHRIYRNVSGLVKDSHNRQVLRRIAEDELAHSKLWQRYTGLASEGKRHEGAFLYLLARVLGFTFALKLMERGEQNAKRPMSSIAEEIPEAGPVAKEVGRARKSPAGALDEEHSELRGRDWS